MLRQFSVHHPLCNGVNYRAPTLLALQFICTIMQSISPCYISGNVCHLLDLFFPCYIKIIVIECCYFTTHICRHSLAVRFDLRLYIAGVKHQIGVAHAHGVLYCIFILVQQLLLICASTPLFMSYHAEVDYSVFDCKRKTNSNARQQFLSRDVM